MVGAELGDGVADALEQSDRLGELAGGLVRRGEVVEGGQGVGVVRAELPIWASRTRSNRSIASVSFRRPRTPRRGR